MKTSASTSILLASLALFAAPDACAATPLASVASMPRFLAEKSILQAELDAWKKSDAGLYAKELDFITKPISGESTDEAVLEDQLHRFFLTKLHIEEVQRENPDAVFSTDSPFTLMTDDEFTAYVRKSLAHGGDSKRVFRGVASAPAPAPLNDVAPLEDKDWTTSGCVAPVKNQGQCGSCWAYAAVGALESAYCLKGNSLTTFSEQQVLSCDSASQGCQGGYPGDGLDFIQKNGGLCRGSDYEYTSGQSGDAGQCQASQCSPVQVAIQQVVSVPESDAGLLAAVSKTPVAVGVAAGNRTWKQYKNGVVSTCDTTQLDHAVVVVGYGGSGSAAPYYKIKNSWGTAWGESGFIRLKRGGAGAGTCGVVGPKSVYPVL